MELDREISWYYGQGRDPARLQCADQLEAARTCQIISKRLQSGPLRIVDIGGGAGHYSFWLAEQGHEVSLIDPVQIHVDCARAHAQETGVRLAEVHLAAASSLPFESETFDIALMFGPMYHLTERSERIEALTEAFRVLKAGGTLFVSTINRYSWAVKGFFKDLLPDEHFLQAVRQDMRSGLHLNPERRRGLFTKAYFHLPSELRAEMVEAGCLNVDLISIEGVFSLVPDFETKWTEPTFRKLLLDTLEEMESEPSVLGLAGHLMGVGRRRPFDNARQV